MWVQHSVEGKLSQVFCVLECALAVCHQLQFGRPGTRWRPSW